MSQLEQKGAACRWPGCAAVATHYCPEPTCGELCSEHEQRLHTSALFPSHKAATVPIAHKAVALQRKLEEPAAKIRAQIANSMTRQQNQLQSAEAELKQLKLQVEQKEQQFQAKLKALEAAQLTAKQMATADNSAVLEMGLLTRPLIDSTILNALDDAPVVALQEFLEDQRSLSNAKMIYRGSRDGFKAEEWWRLCAGKSNQLTIIRVKSNGFVFGAFTPFRWPLQATKNGAIADPSGATFLFSLVNAHDRAVKLRLKESKKMHAGRVFTVIGMGDIALMCMGKSSDVDRGCYLSPTAFEFDCAADGGAPIPYDKTLLAGCASIFSSSSYFAAEELESWQM